MTSPTVLKYSKRGGWIFSRPPPLGPVRTGMFRCLGEKAITRQEAEGADTIASRRRASRTQFQLHTCSLRNTVTHVLAADQEQSSPGNQMFQRNEHTT